MLAALPSKAVASLAVAALVALLPPAPELVPPGGGPDVICAHGTCSRAPAGGGAAGRRADYAPGLTAPELVPPGGGPAVICAHGTCARAPAAVGGVSERRADYALGLTREGRLRRCPGSKQCVSSAGGEAPNKAMAPLSYAPTPRLEAFARLLRELRGNPEVTVEEEDAESGYVRAAVVPASGGDAEDLEVQVLPGTLGLAAFRDTARSTRAPPPWCVKKGCLNGNQTQRSRMQALAASLSWSPTDTGALQEDAEWKPIFLK